MIFTFIYLAIRLNFYLPCPFRIMVNNGFPLLPVSLLQTFFYTLPSLLVHAVTYKQKHVKFFKVVFPSTAEEFLVVYDNTYHMSV